MYGLSKYHTSSSAVICLNVKGEGDVLSYLRVAGHFICHIGRLARS